jgi:hypothetical protein
LFQLANGGGQSSCGGRWRPFEGDFARIGPGRERALEPVVGLFVLAIPVQELGQFQLALDGGVFPAGMRGEAIGIPPCGHDARGNPQRIEAGGEKTAVVVEDGQIEIPGDRFPEGCDVGRPCVEGILAVVAVGIDQHPAGSFAMAAPASAKVFSSRF